MYTANQNRKRMTISFVIAFLFHAAVFTGVQFILPEDLGKIEEYRGPLLVTIERERPPQPVEVVKKTPVEKKAEERSRPEVKKEMPAPRKESRTPQSGAVSSAVPSVEEKGIVPDTSGPAVHERNVDLMEMEKFWDSIPAPLEEEEGPPPITTRQYEEEKKKDSVPFQSKSEIARESLALDVGKLDEAFESEAQSVSNGGKAKGPVSDTGEIGTVNAPLIVWDDTSQKRSLTYKGPSPDIPLWVKKEGLDLRAAISFAVTAEGHTTSVKIRQSSGYSDVDSAILDAVRKMKFNPLPGGSLVTGTITYIISPR
jgi:TonB family protein